MDFTRQRSQLIQRMVDFRKKQHWNSLQQKHYLLFPVSVKNEFGSCSKRNAGQITTNLSSVLCQNKFGNCSKRNAGQITTNLSSVLWLRPLARPLAETLGYKGAGRGFNPDLGALDFISARFLITNG
jgi:hypothetical protein